MPRETDAADSLANEGSPEADRHLAENFGMTLKQLREFDPQTLDVTRACKFLGLPLKRFDLLGSQSGARGRWVDSIAREKRNLIETFPEASQDVKEMLEAIRKFALRKCLNPDSPALMDGRRPQDEDFGGGGFLGRNRFFLWGGTLVLFAFACGLVAVFMPKDGPSKQRTTVVDTAPPSSGKGASTVRTNQPIPPSEPVANKPTAVPNLQVNKPDPDPRPTTDPAPRTVTSFNGYWTGQHSNSDGWKGYGKLTLTEDGDGAISGTWFATKVSGRREGKKTSVLRGKDDGQSMQLNCTIEGGVMKIEYSVTKGSGETAYTGKSNLRRVNVIVRAKNKLLDDAVVTVELDGKRVTEWPNNLLEVGVPARPGQHQVVIRSAYKGVFYSQTFDAVTVSSDEAIVLDTNKLKVDQPQRVAWTHSAGSFTYQGNGKWLEAPQNGGKYNFVEVVRVTDYVELHDASRNCSVRLLAGSMHLKGLKGYPEFKEYYVGRWEKEATPAPPRPEDLIGMWNSDFGKVSLEITKSGVISGYWVQDLNKKGVITGGAFTPGTRTLTFLIAQPWNNEKGSATFTLSADSTKLDGTWKHSSGNGKWQMTRVAR
ncbi:hypothetical protein [Limnoglobus roseus]|uniref:Uncharacterized protein n=1 Tax=Limnoglobus roseus TaxID=2598579 RepID=A0A5C1ADF4_9BACT|nr:hypothetical protein [Limnoglobus roseus]QEL16665.1 hypothetical protein PX52LOC_03626 [Limnoglobus roseus]